MALGQKLFEEVGKITSFKLPNVVRKLSFNENPTK